MTARAIAAADVRSLTTSTNDNAPAGAVGEIIESTVLDGAAVALVTATAKTITSISLTAGDWDVWGTFGLSPDGTTTTSVFIGAINTTANTLPTFPAAGAYVQFSGAVPAGNRVVQPTGMQRLSLSATTTVYLIGYAAFAVSTMGGFGYLGARRVR